MSITLKSWQSLNIALKAIWVNRTRSILTMLGIIIGIAAVIALMGLGLGAQQQILGSINRLGVNVIRIFPGAQNGGFGEGPLSGAARVAFTARDYNFLANRERFPNIAEISPYLSGREKVVKGSRNENLSINGVSADFNLIQDLAIGQGSFLSVGDIESSRPVAVIGPSVADKLFPGRPLSELIDNTLNIGNYKFSIVGVTAKQPTSMMGDPNLEIYIPYTTAAEKIFKIKEYSAIYVKVNDEKQIDALISRINNKLADYRQVSRTEPDFSFITSQDLQATASQVTGTLTALLASIAAISLVVGGIGISNIMLVSVTERTREIGLRKALGAKPRDITGQFLTEAMVLTGTGGVIGIILGFILGYVAGRLVNINSAISINSILLAVGVAVAIGLGFGFFPAWKAGKMDPIRALRYE